MESRVAADYRSPLPNESQGFMPTRVMVRWVGVALVMAMAAPISFGYIHFPPSTLQKLSIISTQIRVLSVKKYDKEKGVVVFEVVESLKGDNNKIKSFKHAIRTDAEGVKPIFDWVGDGKRAVMFTIEGDPRAKQLACGYVFIEDYCYSVDYNHDGEFWLLIRGEPNMSACYQGSADKLQQLTKEILDGKDVKVPVKERETPESKEDQEKRRKEVNDILIKNRNK
jgi:hypothetical protein